MGSKNDANEALLCGGEDISALVVDLGFCTSKIGHNQEDTPRIFLNSICGERIYVEDARTRGTEQNSYSDSGGSGSSGKSGRSGGSGCSGSRRSVGRRGSRLKFPLNLYNRDEHVRIKPLFERDKGGTVSLNGDVFEKILEYAIEGVTVKRVFECSDEVIDPIKLGGLNLNFEDHPILLSESNIHNNKIREEITEILFEKYNVPALYFAKKAKLTSFSLGRSNSLVIDVGFSSMNINPVYEGYVLQKNAFEYNIGGDYFDKLIYEKLKRDHINIVPYFCTNGNFKKGERTADLFRNIHSSYRKEAILDIVRYMKESVCRIRVENSTPRSDTGGSGSGSGSASVSASGSVGGSVVGGSVGGRGNVIFNNADNGTPNSTVKDIPNDIPPGEEYFELPDGAKINIDKYKYDIAENLFKSMPGENNFKGLPQSIINCILSSDVDIRKDLLQSIIVTGGSSQFPGLVERLLNSLKEKECFTQSVKLKILNTTSLVESTYSSWLGGSILASLGTFQQLWVSKREFLESGHALIFDRCF
ncbi:actin-related protein, putative [Plasmodium ovale]|uniref:Actin-related protein, putative n=2 Tax=Plasmodium ovale TaxID=36330 RepID=A0A1D3TMN9_PLAOA|nr:actin-related protein, putative (ARP4a) [Plasmodium ovale curtisi]SBS97591.1 actin-related protein, putative (ARP4a) [Plasmodium ovale curtisi]SCP06189.1 actin-related protein, putative [Plasmodium ovale]